MCAMKYTREVLEQAVTQAFSFAQVVRILGRKPNGGNQTYISNKIRKFKISVQHFTGQASNRGKPNRNKRVWSEILVFDRLGQRKESTHRLRRAMIESGIPHHCNNCKQPPLWLDSPLSLQVDHINGNSLDNRRENLRFLCPNCHSQTENWGSKKRSARVA